MIKTLAGIWPIITSIIAVTVIISAIDQKVFAVTERVNKLENIEKDIVEIKVKVERIDERLDSLRKREK